MYFSTLNECFLKKLQVSCSGEWDWVLNFSFCFSHCYCIGMQGISVCEFCILQLYCIHWLALVIFWWYLCAFLCRGSCHLQTVRVLLLLFQSGFLLFLFLLWLLWLRLPKLCWMVVVRVGTLVLFLILKELFQFFAIEDNVCCGFVIYGFYYVEVCSYYPCFLERFYHKWVLNFVKGFLCIYWDNHMVFIFQLIWGFTLIDLWILENACIPGIKPTWSWCMTF